jgi:hypothetical protein
MTAMGTMPNVASQGCVCFVAKENAWLKAVGLMTLNHNEEVAINVYESWDEALQQSSGLRLSSSMTVKEKGYHVVDLSQEVQLWEGEEFVIAEGFAAKPGAEEPLAYVVNNDQTPGPEKTYRTSFDLARFSEWTDYTDIYPNAVFYIQGIVSR